GLERAVSFTKGCYIGQEIVARIASRGGVNRRLVRLRSQSAMTPGASVSVDGAAVGQVTSAPQSDATGPNALAHVKVEPARVGQRVAIDGVPGEVTGGDSRR